MREYYFDFAPSLTEKSAIRPLVENDAGVQSRVQDAARSAHHVVECARRAARRTFRNTENLTAVRSEFLDTFVAALEPLGVLDRFKLAGVIATWWTDTLPDFKTLLENGFPGVIDGWVDAIADAVDDDEAAGPTFDPFAHKLVRRVMSRLPRANRHRQRPMLRGSKARRKPSSRATNPTTPTKRS